MSVRIFRTAPKGGFTLLELVIVLGITGLIFGGLWGLISGGGAQLQAQSAAQQYRQVIEATRRLLAPGQDQVNGATSFIPGTFPPGSHDGVTPGAPAEVPINTLIGLGLLSPNFAQLSGGVYSDAFGHTIRVAAQRMDDTTSKWRFVVFSVPNGAPLISDKVGAQIASLIGSEGGFIYSAATEGCSSASNFSVITCGSYNAFAFDINANGFGTLVAPSSGRIATLSFTSDSSTVGAPWLMRIIAPPTTDFNTMSAPLNFKVSSPAGNNSLTMNANPVFLNDGTLSVGSSLAGTTSAGKITMNGGGFWMGADSATTGGGTLSMAAGILDMMQGPINNVPTITNTGSVSLDSGSGNLNLGSNLGVIIGLPHGIASDPTLVSLAITGTGRSDIFQAGQFIYTSDISMKQNIKPIPNALEKIMKLHGYTYDWKANHVADVGLVAQDVEKVFPELVSSIGNDRKGVDYAKMVAPLVEAIRELKLQNDALSRRIDALQKHSTAP